MAFFRHSRSTVPASYYSSGFRIFFLLFAFPVVLLLAGLGLDSFFDGLAELADAGTPLNRIDRQPTAEETAAGRVWQTTQIGPSGADAPPLCLVIHEHYQSGKNGGWREDQRWYFETNGTAAVHGRGQARFPVSNLRIIPERLGPMDGSHESEFRSRVPSMRYDGRLREQCLRPGQQVFIDGCITTSSSEFGAPTTQLTGCGNEQFTIAIGDDPHQVLKDNRAVGVGGNLLAGAATLYGLCFVLWFLSRRRDLPEQLKQWRPAIWKGNTPFGILCSVLGVLTVGYWIAQWAMYSSNDGVSRMTYCFLAAIYACVVIAAYYLLREHSRVIAAAGPLRQQKEVSLAAVGGTTAEMSARIAPDARVVNGPLSAKPRAWVWLVVSEQYTANKSTYVHTLLNTIAASGPIPVVDASGPGLLSLGGGVVNCRTVEKVFSAGRVPKNIAAMLSRQPTRGASVCVREHYLEPNEPVFLYGQTSRSTEQTKDDGYRNTTAIPLISNAGTETLFVFAGTKQDLFKALTRQTLWLAGLGSVIAITTAVTLGSWLYLVSQ